MAQRTANSISGFEGCELHFEQDSKTVFGLQVADLAAHTCATMLSETLGLVTKSVKINHPGYADIDEVNLGFLLWAGVRDNFLSTSKTDNPDHLDFATLDAEKYGLFIHESATDLVSKAAKERFGTMYVGCIH